MKVVFLRYAVYDNENVMVKGLYGYENINLSFDKMTRLVKCLTDDERY